uniref:InlB B-repeat-containing protein n=1 Tax=Acetobacterium malicum TaxID=52692 RepID=UPI003593E5DA
MKKFKNLAVVLSLVLVLNTILPQAAVFAQAANNSLETNGSTVNVTLADVDPAFGTVTLSGGGQTGAGAYPQGSTLKVNAVANPGYAVYLISASMGGLIYETPLTPTTFSLTADTVITVSFYAVTPPPVSTVQVQVEDLNPTLGNVTFSGANGQTGNGAYPTGSTLNINVTPVNGFKVTSITAAFADGTSQEVDNQPTADFILHDDVIISFSFEGAYNIVVESSDPTRGTVFNESGSYSLLDSIYLYAMPNPGYECNGYYFTDANNYSSYTPYTQPVNVPVTESGTYQMIFEPIMCLVAVVSDGNGTVTGGGNVANGSKVTLTATPDSGYKFNQWTDQNNVVVGTSATLNIAVTDNITYTASFVPDTVVIQVSGNPTGGGTVSGDGTYVSGASVTLTATPAAGYTFVNWINMESQAVVSKNTSCEFTASAATAGMYAAVFQATEIPVKISTIASPAALQTITVTPVSGNYTSGTVLALSASSTDSGVTFSGWYANGVLLSKSPTFSYTVTEPVLINAVFGTNWGSVIVLGNPFSSRNADIEVQPIGTNLSFNGSSDTYDFVNWTNSAGKVVSTDPNLTVQVQKGLQTYIANVTPKTFTISVGATPTPGGTAQVTSATSITYGKTATVVATPANGYSFTGWTDGDTGQSVSTDQTYSFEPSKNTRLIANFSQQGYTLSLTANPTNGGTVSSGGTNLVYGQVINIQATPADGYVFSGWVDGSGNTVSSKPNASITITGNQALTANFSAVQYPITVTPSPAAGGTVAGGGSFEDGASVTLTAIPNVNYNFIRWTQGDSDLAVSTNPQYTFTASEASQGQYTAVFAPETYLVNISMVAQKSIEDQVSVSPAKDIYSYGTVLNMAANTTNTEILFLGWFEDGKLISKTADFNYTVTKATNLVAVFVTDYGVIITQGDPTAAKKTDILIGPKNTTKPISAETSPNYDFVNWTDAAGTIYPDDTVDVTIGPDLVETYVAHYTPKTFTVVAAGQTPGGTVNQSQASVLYGQSLTVTATPDSGYTFTNWTDALADPQPGAVLSTDANWILQPDANMSLQANFAPIAYILGINVAANGGGTAAWTNYPTAGPFYGDVITAIATPDPNYVFDGWVNGVGDIVSLDSTFDITVTGNDTLTAQFHTSQNNIGVVANPTTMGTVTGGGTYAYQTQATLTAIPNTGFEFVNWTNNLDDTVITTPELVVNVANDVIYTANFDVLQCPVTLTPVDPGRSVYGSVVMAVYENGVLAPAGTNPEYGDKVVLTATPNQTMPNAIFKDYLDSSGTLISYDAVYTIEAISEPLAIQYDFVQEYTVTVPVSAEWTDNYQRNLLPGVVPQVTQFPNSQVTGNFKDSITLNYGTVDTNLVFDGWYTDEETPVLVSNEPSFSYQLLDSTPLVAKLHLKDVGILVENAYIPDQPLPRVDLNGGEVSGSGYRNAGEIFNVSSTVDANYSFENWTQGNTTLSKKTSFDYTVAGQPGIDAPPIQANYSPNACYLTLNVSPKGGGLAAPSGYYPYGTLVTISQGNQAGYAFSHFEDSNGNTLKSVTSNTKAGTLTLYMTGNTTVVAVYKESSGSEAQKIVKIAAAAATAAAIAAGIAAAIYFGGDELLADGALDLAEVALEDLGEVAGGVVDKNPPDPDPDPDDPDNKTDILITSVASPLDGGTAIGGESYRVGEMAVLKATANPGWVFANWTCEGAVVIDDP